MTTLDPALDKLRNKELSFGCIFRFIEIYRVIYTNDNGIIRLCDTHKMYTAEEILYNKTLNIIGHPVMIGDVLDWIYLNDKPPITRSMMLDKRDTKRKPIDDQSDECIKFVYDLLPTK